MTGLAPWLAASYLLGSIPTSYLTVRLIKGQDLRSLGSGNLGATNLFRVMGWKYAIPVALFDMLKGAVPVLLFAPRAGGSDTTAILLGLAAIAGHVFSIFVGFKGGKGVATGAGVVLGLAPWAFVVALAVWALLVKTTGYVSLGSIVASGILPLAVYILHPERRPLVWVFGGIATAILLLHHKNIRRLLAGTENRFGRRAA